jgi:hypothetical protein
MRFRVPPRSARSSADSALLDLEERKQGETGLSMLKGSIGDLQAKGTPSPRSLLLVRVAILIHAILTPHFICVSDGSNHALEARRPA